MVSWSSRLFSLGQFQFHLTDGVLDVQGQAYVGTNIPGSVEDAVEITSE